MFRHHQSPRHLDDPMRPVFGLSIAQAGGALLAIAAAAGTWRLLGRAAHPGPLLAEARIFATGAVAAAIFFAAYALAGDRTEPFARQLWAYARRPHHYVPSPLVTSPPEDAHEHPATPAAPGQRQLRPAALPSAPIRLRPARRRDRR